MRSWIAAVVVVVCGGEARGVGASDRARSQPKRVGRRASWGGGQLYWPVGHPRFGGIGTSSGSHLSVSVARPPPRRLCMDQVYLQLLRCWCGFPFHAIRNRCENCASDHDRGAVGPGVWNIQDGSVDMVSAGGSNRDLRVGYANVWLSSSCLGFFFLLVGHRIIETGAILM
jgi:hypothetical protein